MMVSCLRGGLNPDLSRCYPNNGNIMMVLDEGLEIRFRNIYNCQIESNLNFEKLLTNQKEIGFNEQTLADRKAFLKTHKKAIIQRFKTGMIDAIFFDSIQQEILSNILTETKLSCKVDLVYKGKIVTLTQLKKVNKKFYKLACKYLISLKVCETISIEEYEKYSKNNFMKLDIKSASLGALAASALFAAGLAILKGAV